MFVDETLLLQKAEAYAGRHGLKLGDRLGLEMHGRPLHDALRILHPAQRCRLKTRNRRFSPSGLNSLREPYTPPLFAAVHAHQDVCCSGRVLGRVIEDQEVWAKLPNRESLAVQDQVYPYFRRVSVVFFPDSRKPKA